MNREDINRYKTIDAISNHFWNEKEYIFLSDFNKYADEKEKEIEKLKKYAQHKADCDFLALPVLALAKNKKCTCGLDDLLNKGSI